MPTRRSGDRSAAPDRHPPAQQPPLHEAASGAAGRTRQASRSPAIAVAAKAATKAAGPGRPKDLAKRAAILEAAKQMFVQHGFQGAGMDLIAARAGVSKLTVYSHFGDKERLFSAAVASYCEQQLPHSLFTRSTHMPLRERLLAIAHAFHVLISSPEAIAVHRMLCTPQVAGSPLSQMFWDAGPRRVLDELIQLLQRRIAAGELAIDGADPDAVQRAGGQLLSLLKGEPHAMLLLGCGQLTPAAVDVHLEAAVDTFLRAYASTPAGVDDHSR